VNEFSNINVYPQLIQFARNGKFPDKWRPIYDVLIGIRNELDKLSLTQAWSLRETDLYDFQRQLDKIDESRVDGNWLDEDGQPAELYVQRVCTPKQTGMGHHLLIVIADTFISHPAVVRLHLSFNDLIRARIRGTTANL
jgi:hypothetical protein